MTFTFVRAEGADPALSRSIALLYDEAGQETPFNVPSTVRLLAQAEREDVLARN